MNSSTDIHRRERIHDLRSSHTRDYFTLGKSRKSRYPTQEPYIPHTLTAINPSNHLPSFTNPTNRPINPTPYFPTLLPRTPQLLTINPPFPLHILHHIRIKPKFLSMGTVRYAAETNAEFRCIRAVLFWV